MLFMCGDMYLCTKNFPFFLVRALLKKLVKRGIHADTHRHIYTKAILLTAGIKAEKREKRSSPLFLCLTHLALCSQ